MWVCGIVLCSTAARFFVEHARAVRVIIWAISKNPLAVFPLPASGLVKTRAPPYRTPGGAETREEGFLGTCGGTQGKHAGTCAPS